MSTYFRICIILIVFSLKDVRSFIQGDVYKKILHLDFGESPGSPKCNGKCGQPVYLTKYLLQNKTDDGRCAARVNSTLMKGVKSYSGFITVNQTYNTNLWFWYFPATSQSAKEAPLLVYPSLAPGVHSTYDLLTAISPYIITRNGTLEKNNSTWTRRHSVIVIDAPAGTGLSFTDDDRGYAVNASQVGQQLYTFMKQIRLIFVELQTADIYLVGSLFGSVQASSIGIKILENGRNKSPFDIKGLIIFDGFNEANVKFNISKFNLVTGLIDKQTAKKIADLENAAIKAVEVEDVSNIVKLYGKALQLLIDARPLPSPWSFKLDTTVPPSVYINFLQRPDVRSSLHVGDLQLRVVDKAYDKMQTDIYSGTSAPWFAKLINNYPVLFVSGMLYPLGPYFAQADYYDSLEFKNANAFRNASRRMWQYNGNTKGYYKEAKNITSLVLRDMGNFLGRERPALVEYLIHTFTVHQRIDT